MTDRGWIEHQCSHTLKYKQPSLSVLYSLRSWNFLVRQLQKHSFEFLEIDQAVIVLIDLCDDRLPDSIICGSVLAQNLRDLSCLDCAATIFIEKLEGSKHVLFVHQRVLINGCSAPFGEVDCATSISIRFIENFKCTFRCSLLVLLGIKLRVAIDELLCLNQTITVLIELVECFAKFLLLSFGCQMASHKCQRSLLHLGFALFKFKHKRINFVTEVTSLPIVSNNRLLTWNCSRLLMDCLPRASLKRVLTYDLIHGCARAVTASILLSIFFSMSFVIKSLAYSLIDGQASPEKVQVPLLTFFIISGSEAALNGGFPLSIM